jgi:hypothetical protein
MTSNNVTSQTAMIGHQPRAQISRTSNSDMKNSDFRTECDDDDDYYAHARSSPNKYNIPESLPLPLTNNTEDVSIDSSLNHVMIPTVTPLKKSSKQGRADARRRSSSISSGNGFFQMNHFLSINRGDQQRLSYLQTPMGNESWYNNNISSPPLHNMKSDIEYINTDCVSGCLLMPDDF